MTTKITPGTVTVDMSKLRSESDRDLQYCPLCGLLAGPQDPTTGQRYHIRCLIDELRLARATATDLKRQLMEAWGTKPLDQPARKTFLRPEWCPHDGGHDWRNDKIMMVPDNSCRCGVVKHHAHCMHGYLVQVG